MSVTEYIPQSHQIAVKHITPEIDCGRYAAKRVIDDVVKVAAGIVCDGHDRIAAALRYRRADGGGCCAAG